MVLRRGRVQAALPARPASTWSSTGRARCWCSPTAGRPYRDLPHVLGRAGHADRVRHLPLLPQDARHEREGDGALVLLHRRVRDPRLPVGAELPGQPRLPAGADPERAGRSSTGSTSATRSSRTGSAGERPRPDRTGPPRFPLWLCRPTGPAGLVVYSAGRAPLTATASALRSAAQPRATGAAGVGGLHGLGDRGLAAAGSTATRRPARPARPARRGAATGSAAAVGSTTGSAPPSVSTTGSAATGSAGTGAGAATGSAATRSRDRLRRHRLRRTVACDLGRRPGRRPAPSPGHRRAGALLERAVRGAPGSWMRPS